MINGQSVMAVIPARGGSKRVQRKNLRFFNDRWLIAYSADAARGSKYLDHFVLSSENESILEQGRKLGIPTIERPAWLATDKAMCEGVLVHTLYTYKWADWIVLLQPTSPQRTAADIDIAIERAQHGIGCVTLNEYGMRNGAVYVARSEWLIASIEFHRDLAYINYTMPNERSLDIDYEVDFELAERKRD